MEKPIYECTGCGTVSRDPKKWLGMCHKAGGISCCPERNIVLLQADGELERLRAEVEQVRNSTPFQHGYRFGRGSDVREIDRIRRQLADAQALLRERDRLIYGVIGASGKKRAEYLSKLHELVSATAQHVDGAKS